jgi:hypothetical protein
MYILICASFFRLMYICNLCFPFHVVVEWSTGNGRNLFHVRMTFSFKFDRGQHTGPEVSTLTRRGLRRLNQTTRLPPTTSKGLPLPGACWARPWSCAPTTYVSENAYVMTIPGFLCFTRFYFLRSVNGCFEYGREEENSSSNLKGDLRVSYWSWLNEHWRITQLKRTVSDYSIATCMLYTQPKSEMHSWKGKQWRIVPGLVTKIFDLCIRS